MYDSLDRQINIYFSRLGRVQSLISQLLHVSLGEAEQPLPALSARMGRPANRKIAADRFPSMFLV